MTWKTLLDLLAFEFRRVRSLPVVNFGFTVQPVLDVDELRNEELRHAARVDCIVRDFARTRRWPSLDEKERYFLRERLRFAYEYGAIAEISAPHPLRIATRSHLLNSRRRSIEWLLIDVWRTSGVLNWLEPLTLLEESGSLAESTRWEFETTA